MRKTNIYKHKLMTSVEIVIMYDRFAWYKKIIGLHMVMELTVNTTEGLEYNIKLSKGYLKWLCFTLKTYIPNG